MAAEAQLTSSGAAELIALQRRREVSAAEVVASHLERIEAVNPALNAVVQLRADAARAEAENADAALARGDERWPLHGLPLTVKDCFAVAGLPATNGTLGRAGSVPDQDDVVVSRLRRAGAIVLGKTNCPELLLAFETDNLVYGRTNNPYALDRTPGGSSGGEAAIVAAGGSPLGLGSDSGGSIRVPAHFCGIVGLKPTHGRVPIASTVSPTLGVMSRLRSIGPLARSVADLALALPVLAGPDRRDPWTLPVELRDPEQVDVSRLRVAWFGDDGMIHPSPEIQEAVRSAAGALASAGAEVEEARPQGFEKAFDIYTGATAADGGAAPRAALRMLGTTETSPLLESMLRRLAERETSVAGLNAHLVAWDLLRGSMLAFMAGYDVVLCPVAATAALRHGETSDRLEAFGYAFAFNLTGWPVVTLRAGTSAEGLPIGVQVAAAPWHEDVALAAAAQIEQRSRGFAPPPL